MCVLVSLSEAVKYFLEGFTIGFVLCCLAFDEHHILDTSRSIFCNGCDQNRSFCHLILTHDFNFFFFLQVISLDLSWLGSVCFQFSS